jgi:4-amino-4-deoxy-L-arabinose transferase-like glycosyltransferase
MAISSFTAFAFFYYLNKLSKSWNKYPEAVFRKKVFTNAVWIRVIVITIMYGLFMYLYGWPYEAGAADAGFYVNTGYALSDSILNGQWNFFEQMHGVDLSDMGYPIYMGFVFTLVFKSVYLVRILTAFIGAWACLLIYDLAKRNFGEQVARIAAIMMMLYPNLIYYAGLTLKEELMVTITIAYVNLADKLLKAKRIKAKDIIWLTLLGASLFLFRTVLAVCMVLSLFTCIVIVSRRVSRRGRRMFLGIWVLVAMLAIFYSSVGDSIRQLISQSETNQESQLSHFSNRQNGNAFAKYGSVGIFLPMILIAPFPTFVNTYQENQMMIAGGVYTRNVFAFFVIIAFISMYKKKLLTKHCVIIVSFSSYLLVIASSGFALSERFHLPAAPFLIILAAYGITEMNAKRKKAYVPYLVFMALLLIGWNWFKVAGRGL